MSESGEHFERHISITDNTDSTVACLANETGLSKKNIKQAMQKGCVWLTRNNHTQRLRRAKRELKSGDTLHIYYNEKILNQQPAPAKLISNEGAYSLWYKPCGMYSQGSKWGDHCAINRWVEQEMQQPVFVIHRLDRAASGLMLIAHQKKVAAILADLFQRRRIDKRYQVLVHGHFPEKQAPKKFDKPIDDRSAISFVHSIGYRPDSRQSLLEVKIETGRKHQIRRHLSEAGYPIVGDRLYGREGDEQDLQLCCSYLGFGCPVSGEEKQFKLDESSRLFSQKTSTQ